MVRSGPLISSDFPSLHPWGVTRFPALRSRTILTGRLLVEWHYPSAIAVLDEISTGNRSSGDRRVTDYDKRVILVILWWYLVPRHYLGTSYFSFLVPLSPRTTQLN